MKIPQSESYYLIENYYALLYAILTTGPAKRALMKFGLFEGVGDSKLYKQGRKGTKITDAMVKEFNKLYAKGYYFTEIGKICGVSYSSAQLWVGYRFTHKQQQEIRQQNIEEIREKVSACGKKSNNKS